MRKFNLHTIIRLPGSIFSPYTSIATNILFFNNEAADDCAEGFRTKDVWFYRLDMPEGYKHFSKTKPMKLEHCQPIKDWWNDRQEIIGDEIGEKSRVFSAQQLLDIVISTSASFQRTMRKYCLLPSCLPTTSRSARHSTMR